jgi:uncharacterized membrane protein
MLLCCLLVCCKEACSCSVCACAVLWSTCHVDVSVATAAAAVNGSCIALLPVQELSLFATTILALPLTLIRIVLMLLLLLYVLLHIRLSVGCLYRRQRCGVCREQRERVTPKLVTVSSSKSRVLQCCTTLKPSAKG